MGQFSLMKHRPPSMFQHNQNTQCAFSCGDDMAIKPITHCTAQYIESLYED